MTRARAVGIQSQEIRDQDKAVLSAYLSPQRFAEFLVYLLRGTDAHLGILEWKPLLSIRSRSKKAIVDANAALVTEKPDGGVDLLIPDWRRLRSLYLLAFYKDGSIMSAQLGTSDTLEVIRGGQDSDAAVRVANAKAFLGPGRRALAVRLIGGLAPVGALIVSSLYIPYSGVWDILGLLSFLAGFVGFMAFVSREATGSLRPRESWLGLGWRSLEWTKADIRNLLIGALLFALGVMVGH